MAAGTFTSLPTPPDSTPDPFIFLPVTNAALSTEYESDPVTLTGMNAAASFTVEGGTLMVGSDDLGASGTLAANPTIRAKLTSSADYETPAIASVTIGGVSADFEVTTAAAPGVIYPAEIEPPTALPASTGDYNDPGSPITTMAALTSAIGAATAGQTIWVSGNYTFTSGVATLDLANVNKGVANPVRIRSANPEAMAALRGAYTGDHPAIRLSNCKGLAFIDLDIAILDAPSVAGDGWKIMHIKDNCENLWWVNCKVHGNTNGDGAGVFAGITNPTGDAPSNINFIGNTFSKLNSNIVLIGCNGVQSAFNTFELFNGDCHQLMGAHNVKLYLNVMRDPRAISGVHPDFCQLATGAGNQLDMSNICAWRNFLCNDPSQPLQAGSGVRVSIGRTQGFLVQDDANGNGGTPTTATLAMYSGIRIQENIIYGGEQAGIAFGKQFAAWTDINIVDNELYHMSSPNDTLTGLQLRFNGPVYPASGTITGNIAHEIATASATNMTGQVLNQAKDPSLEKTAADRDAHLAAWQVERDAFYAAL